MLHNRRDFFRLSLKVPLTSRFKIVGYNNEAIESNFAHVYVIDISAGGFKIHTKLNLPMGENLLLEFRFQLFQVQHRLIGTIVRKRNFTNTIYEYGIRFSFDEHERDALLGHIHLLQIRLKTNEVLASCSFCSDDEIKRFYGE